MIMVTCWERCESRGSRTVLREADGEVPLVYSPDHIRGDDKVMEC